MGVEIQPPTEQTPCGPYWSFERPKSKMKLSLIIMLSLAAMSFASPMRPIDRFFPVSEREGVGGFWGWLNVDPARRSLNGCPYRVEIDIGPGGSLPSNPFRKYYTTYTKQSGTVSGRDWNLSSNGKYMIWYFEESDGSGSWNVGTDIDNTELVADHSEADWPHQTGFDWEYLAYMEWSYAGRGMTINEV